MEKIDFDKKIKELEKKRPKLSDAQKAEYRKNLIVDGFNKEYAIVNVAGKTFVMNEFINPVFKHPSYTLSTIEDFKSKYWNLKLGNFNPYTKIWLEHENRRQYKGIIFSPNEDIEDYYNLWQGYPFEPKRGNWSLFRDHIKKNICNNDKESYTWLMCWLSRIIQDPGADNLPGACVILQGEQGTGKSFFVERFGELFGEHFLNIIDQKRLTGRFNKQLENKLLVFADEAFWAGDKKSSGIIRGIITGLTLIIEEKYVPVYKAVNRVNLIIASNKDWVVPAGIKERRFSVFKVGDKNRNDTSYFNSIKEQLENGGYEAMFYDLLEWDYKQVNLRVNLKNTHLYEQKIYEMSDIEKWWFDCLMSGDLFDDFDEYEKDKGWRTQDLWNMYIEFCKTIGSKYRDSASVFVKKLKKMCKTIKHYRPSGEPRRLILPNLKDAQNLFDEYIGMETNWNEWSEIKIPKPKYVFDAYEKNEIDEMFRYDPDV